MRLRQGETERKGHPMKRDPNVNKNPVVEGRRGAGSALLRHLGATRLGVWVIKHIVSPLDRWLYRRTGGSEFQRDVPWARCCC